MHMLSALQNLTNEKFDKFADAQISLQVISDGEKEASWMESRRKEQKEIEEVHIIMGNDHISFCAWLSKHTARQRFKKKQKQMTWISSAC